MNLNSDRAQRAPGLYMYSIEVSHSAIERAPYATTIR